MVGNWFYFIKRSRSTLIHFSFPCLIYRDAESSQLFHPTKQYCHHSPRKSRWRILKQKTYLLLVTAKNTIHDTRHAALACFLCLGDSCFPDLIQTRSHINMSTSDLIARNALRQNEYSSSHRVGFLDSQWR